MAQSKREAALDKAEFKPKKTRGRRTKLEEARIRDLVSPYAPDAIKTVVNLMFNAERDADKISAAKLLLSYGFGTPTQMVEVSAKNDLALNISPVNFINVDPIEKDGDTNDK
tara:strand:+ start:1011 stop:1346 length:336 start_codon:yes stop_codon:yes gene_type:complete